MTTGAGASRASSWANALPPKWIVVRLKTVADYFVSSVDKVPSEDELPVRLCNYTDVYYHDTITPDMDLMETTATADEIRRFALRAGDVVITKDSEDWRDIAVPALVVESADDLVCGYHLAVVRPDQTRLDSAFLLRAFQSSAVNEQFRIASNGVTRFGLPKSAIGEALIPLPPLEVQRTIAEVLQTRTARIDALISKKRALVVRLREKRQALISRVVTRGLPPEAARAASLDAHTEYRLSNIEWLRELPAHWNVRPLRYLFRNLDHQRIPVAAEDRALLDKVYPYYGASGIIDRVDDFIFDEPLILVAEDGANLLSRSTPLAFLATGKYWVNNHAHILRPTVGDIRYWVGVLQSFEYAPLVTGAAQPKLTADRLGSIPLPVPPDHEQRAIADYLDRETSAIDSMIVKVEVAVERLHEYRAALITAAVTGKLEVRSSSGGAETEEVAA